MNRKRAQIVFGTNGADLAESDRESERICKFNPDAIYRAFTSGFAGITLQYMNVLHERDTSNVRGNSQLFIEDFEKRMNASDPVERLLIEQLLLTHYRSLILSRKAAAATHAVVDTITAGLATVLNQQCDQVTNTVRKLILALGEYRAPAQTFAPNINAAHQQIVNQHFRSDRKK